VTYVALLLVVAFAGFISLSYEILWFRAFSFASGGAPTIFGQLLFFYLVGLAVGSFVSRIFCRDRTATGDRRELLPLAGFVFVANLLGFLVLPLLAFLGTLFEAPVAMPFVAVAAASWGAVLPLVSHFAIAPDRLAGSRVSYLYFANIAGSVAGTLLTGFVLLDKWTIGGVALFVALLGLALSAVLLSRSTSARRLRVAGLFVIGLTGIAYAVETRALFERFYERLLAGREYRPSHIPSQIVENRDGVILVTPTLEVFGGGAYDGAISTSLVADKNMIVRAYGIGE